MFVHGNNGDACNFEEHAQHLLNNGWTGDELYSITFADKAPYHEWMRDELDSFVQHVLSETGASQVNVVAHSLGVTGARFWMDDLDRFSWVDTFVSLNGGNHGVCVCPGCYDTTLGTDYNKWLSAGKSCKFIAVQCFADPNHPLYELNLPSETPGDIEYHTVRGFYDPLYYCNPYSPYLAGADNNLIYRNHTSALVDSGTKADVDEWCSTSGMKETNADGASWWVEADVDGYGDTYARVRIEEGAHDADLEIEVYNPNNEVEASTYVYDFEYDDETVVENLQMNGYDAVADDGEWTVAIYDRDRGEYWYVDSTNFDDYNPTLVHDEYEYHQESDGDYYLDRWAITIENKGDIPLHVTDVNVEIDGETDYEYPERTLNPGDRDTYVCEDTDTWLSDGTGTYDVNFEMDVDDQLWATGTFDLEVQ